MSQNKEQFDELREDLIKLGRKYKYYKWELTEYLFGVFLINCDHIFSSCVDYHKACQHIDSYVAQIKNIHQKKDSKDEEKNV